MVLSERQQKASALAHELGNMDGVWVTSPLPLDDHAHLRVQIKDVVRIEVVQMLKDWGWDPVLLSVLPRMCTTGLIAACIYEIDIPKPRQDVVDDRPRIQGEIASREKSNYEVEQVLRYLGVGPKR